MENALKKIETVMPTTKLGIQEFAVEINQQLDNGDISGMELLRTFKMFEKLQAAVKDKMIKAAIKEADHYPGNEIEAFGVSFKKVEAGVKYDYSHCNDFTYGEIIKQETKVKKERETRETFLKQIDGSLPTKGTYVDTESGEEIVDPVLYPPVKTSSSTLQVTIK